MNLPRPTPLHIGKNTACHAMCQHILKTMLTWPEESNMHVMLMEQDMRNYIHKCIMKRETRTRHKAEKGVVRSVAHYVERKQSVTGRCLEDRRKTSKSLIASMN